MPCRRRIPTVWDVDCQTARERRPISDSAVGFVAGRSRASRLLALLGDFAEIFLRDSVHRGGEVVRTEAPQREREIFNNIIHYLGPRVHSLSDLMQTPASRPGKSTKQGCQPGSPLAARGAPLTEQPSRNGSHNGCSSHHADSSLIAHPAPLRCSSLRSLCPPPPPLAPPCLPAPRSPLPTCGNGQCA